VGRRPATQLFRPASLFKSSGQRRLSARAAERKRRPGGYQPAPFLGPPYFCIMAFPATRPQTDYQDDVLLLEEEQELRALVVYNDDVNTFDHVIQTLIDVCGHEPEQAEQCTLLIHYKGKCAVKNGTFEELAPRCSAIHDRGISADIV
jgi:ATP-dependent Clp protease adaptor protein ClpS